VQEKNVALSPFPLWQAMVGRGGIPAGSRRWLTVKDGGPPLVNIPHHTLYIKHFHLHSPYSHPPHTHVPLSHIHSGPLVFCHPNPHRSRACFCVTM
jgi:hypothetical protein